MTDASDAAGSTFGCLCAVCFFLFVAGAVFMAGYLLVNGEAWAKRVDARLSALEAKP